MSKLIEPRTLRGFRDYPPELMIPREQLMETARRVFRSYGFAPIDTPAIELTEILLAKVEAGAEINKQLYRFKDAGDRDVALRFDLTVPLARFVSQHFSELGMPFKRYHLGSVWRGESPQAGRYREFMQCDFDTVGTLSNAADIEIALVIHDLLTALGFERFEIHVNNRLVLNGLLAALGLIDKATSLLRSLDKLAKIGRDGVKGEMMAEAGVTAEQALQVIALAETKGSNAEILVQLAERFANNESAKKGVAYLEQLCQVFAIAGVPEERLKIDLSICRGLDYYTGTVYETFLTDLSGHRQHLFGRPLRQPDRSLHQASAARRRRIARPRPLVGGDGGAQTAAKGKHACSGVRDAVRRRPLWRLSAHRPCAACKRHRLRSLSRRQENRGAVPICRKERLPARRHRRPRRVRQGRMESETFGEARRTGGAGICVGRYNSNVNAWSVKRRECRAAFRFTLDASRG